MRTLLTLDMPCFFMMAKFRMRTLLARTSRAGRAGASRAPPRLLQSRPRIARARDGHDPPQPSSRALHRAPPKLALTSPSPCASRQRRTRPAPPKLALASPCSHAPHRSAPPRPSSRWPRQAHARRAGDGRASPRPSAPLRVRFQSSWMCRRSCVMGLFGERGQEGVKENKGRYFGLFIYHFQFVLFSNQG
jgi:hypothetical protein